MEDKQTLPKKATQGSCAPRRELLHTPHFALSAVKSLPMLSFVPSWEQGYRKHLKRAAPTLPSLPSGLGLGRAAPKAAHKIQLSLSFWLPGEPLWFTALCK